MVGKGSSKLLFVFTKHRVEKFAWWSFGFHLNGLSLQISDRCERCESRVFGNLLTVITSELWCFVFCYHQSWYSSPVLMTSWRHRCGVAYFLRQRTNDKMVSGRILCQRRQKLQMSNFLLIFESRFRSTDAVCVLCQLSLGWLLRDKRLLGFHLEEVVVTIKIHPCIYNTCVSSRIVSDLFL